MVCDNPLNIASTPYVDCMVSTVSGHLQNEIDGLTGSWIHLTTVSGSIPDKDAEFVVGPFPEMDLLKILVYVTNGTSDNSNPAVLFFNDDFDINNYGLSLPYIAEPADLIFASQMFIEVSDSPANKFMFSEIHTYPMVGLETFVKSEEHYGGVVAGISLVSGPWKNTTDRITKLIIKFDQTNLPVGSGSVESIRVKVFGMNF